MAKQIIIAIGRECGSGGRIIAEMIGEKMGIEVLDKNLLDDVSEKTSIELKELAKYDEKAKIIGRIIGGSKESEINQVIWDHMKAKSTVGDSFVVVGRCAQEVLKANPNLLSVFICGERYDKFARIVDEYGFTDEGEAEEMRKKIDAERERFHNRYSVFKWGDPSGYDVVLNSSALGLEGTADAIVKIAQIKSESKVVKIVDEDEARRKEQYFRRTNAGF